MIYDQATIVFMHCSLFEGVVLGEPFLQSMCDI
jgi:hypothetical protein